METIAELSHPYICVNGTSYGGSQNWFADKKGFFNRYRTRSGCGVVAIRDSLGYLKGERSVSSTEEYRKSFRDTAKSLLWIPNRFGMSIYRIMILYPLLLRKNGLSLRGFWGASGKKRLPRIEDMLKRDIPVILNIPRILPRRYKKEKLPFYDRTPDTGVFRPVTSTSAHFVVVTGVIRDQDKTYLRISSWGREYYIDYGEFKAFTKKTPFGSFLGNILYLKKSGNEGHGG